MAMLRNADRYTVITEMEAIFFHKFLARSSLFNHINSKLPNAMSQ
jgi:hypothetical protein